MDCIFGAALGALILSAGLHGVPGLGRAQVALARGLLVKPWPVGKLVMGCAQRGNPLYWSLIALLATAAAPTGSVTVTPHGCLASSNGYLRAKIRGAMTLDVDLHDSELECAGGARPDGSGIRVSFAGPLRSDGRRLRMVFGIAGTTEGSAGRALPTNLTVIFEGEQRLFATRGDDKCTADELSQERVGALGGPSRSYRIVARGFCITPVNALNGPEKIVVNSFDFAGRVTFEDADGANTVSPHGARESDGGLK